MSTTNTLAVISGRISGSDEDTTCTYSGLNLSDAIDKFRDDLAFEIGWESADQLENELGERGEIYITHTLAVESDSPISIIGQ